LSSVSAAPRVHVVDEAKRRQAVFTMLSCTLISAIGQTLIKLGTEHLDKNAGLIGTAIGIFTIPLLFAGYCLYGVFAVLMVYSLRHGELSILYPVIALSYVWVTILSVVIFHESMNPFKVIGVLIIMSGVGVLGRGGSR
jgi:drug/metabolite transporter (DMT)-like permease